MFTGMYEGVSPISCTLNHVTPNSYLEHNKSQNSEIMESYELAIVLCESLDLIARIQNH